MSAPELDRLTVIERVLEKRLSQVKASKQLGITSRQRRQRVHQPRYRRDCFGELIQIDGSEHHWFEERGPKCTVLVYIDDATDRLLELNFVDSESPLITPNRHGIILSNMASQ